MGLLLHQEVKLIPIKKINKEPVDPWADTESLSAQSTPEIKPGVRGACCQIDGVRMKYQST